VRRARGDAVFAALLFVVALAPRLYVALAWAGEAVWDGHYYDFGARRIALGRGYSDDLTIAGHLVWHPWAHYPVGYSALLALFYRVLGSGIAIAALANALVGAVLAVVAWALARHAMSPVRARVAGLVVALHPGLIVYAALVMTEPLAALLTLLAFLVAVRDPRPLRGLALGALVLGVAALVRPQALLCAPFLVLVARRDKTRPLREAPLPASPRFRGEVANRAPSPPDRHPSPETGGGTGWGLRAGGPGWGLLAACALALLPVLPWTARNCARMDGCALVSTNAGWNLAIGAFPRATGRFETLRSSDGCREVTGQVQQDRCWLQYGLAQIEAHPLHWLALVPAKLGYTFDHESFAVEYLHEARPEEWPEPRRTLGRDVTTFAHRLLLAAAALGCVAFPRLRGGRGAAVQGAVLAVAAALAAVAMAGDTPHFWPLAVFVSVVPWLPLPGRPAMRPALLLPVSLLATTLVTHAVFFGEDRYHVVVIPVLALLAAGALRPREAVPT
jgi:hypothetical protein